MRQRKKTLTTFYSQFSHNFLFLIFSGYFPSYFGHHGLGPPPPPPSPHPHLDPGLSSWSANPHMAAAQAAMAQAAAEHMQRSASNPGGVAGSNPGSAFGAHHAHAAAAAAHHAHAAAAAAAAQHHPGKAFKSIKVQPKVWFL